MANPKNQIQSYETKTYKYIFVSGSHASGFY